MNENRRKKFIRSATNIAQKVRDDNLLGMTTKGGLLLVFTCSTWQKKKREWHSWFSGKQVTYFPSIVQDAGFQRSTRGQKAIKNVWITQCIFETQFSLLTCTKCTFVGVLHLECQSTVFTHQWPGDKPQKMPHACKWDNRKNDQKFHNSVICHEIHGSPMRV